MMVTSFNMYCSALSVFLVLKNSLGRVSVPKTVKLWGEEKKGKLTH